MNNEEMLQMILDSQKSMAEGIQNQFTAVNERLDRLDTKVDRIDARLTTIEVDHGQNLKGLHDGYAALREIAEETRDDVKILKIISEDQTMVLNLHEEKVSRL